MKENASRSRADDRRVFPRFSQPLKEEQLDNPISLLFMDSPWIEADDGDVEFPRFQQFHHFRDEDTFPRDEEGGNDLMRR